MQSSLKTQLPVKKRLSMQILLILFVVFLLVTILISTFIDFFFIRESDTLRSDLSYALQTSICENVNPLQLYALPLFGENNPLESDMTVSTLDDITNTCDYESGAYITATHQWASLLQLVNMRSSVASLLKQNPYVESFQIIRTPHDQSDSFFGLFSMTNKNLPTNSFTFKQNEQGMLPDYLSEAISEMRTRPEENMTIAEYITGTSKAPKTSLLADSYQTYEVYDFVNSSDFLVRRHTTISEQHSFFNQSLTHIIELEDDPDTTSDILQMNVIDLPEDASDEAKECLDPLKWDCYVLISIASNSHTYIAYYTLLMLLCMTCAMVILYQFFQKKYIMPIAVLAYHMNHYVEGHSDGSTTELKEQPVVNEISLLNNSLLKMELDIRNYIENLNQTMHSKNMMQDDYDTAQNILTNLFPNHYPAFPERVDFDIFSKQTILETSNGSFYNYDLIDKHHLMLFVGETNAAGIDSTVFSVIAFSCLSYLALEHTSPEVILSNANNTIFRGNQASMSIDLFLAIIDLRDGSMSYATAGTPHMYLKSSGSELVALPQQSCIPLGNIEQVHYMNSSITLSQSDLLFLCTKGCVDAINPQGMTYGEDYILSSMNSLLQREFSLKQLGESMEQQLADFTRDASQNSQDRLMLFFRYLGK